MVSLAVTPAQLPALAGKLRVAESTLNGVVQASREASRPLPPAVDDVSQDLAASFLAYQPDFYSPVDFALTGLQQGADVLVPVSTAYESTDIEGGGVVDSHNHSLGCY